LLILASSKVRFIGQTHPVAVSAVKRRPKETTPKAKDTVCVNFIYASKCYADVFWKPASGYGMAEMVIAWFPPCFAIACGSFTGTFFSRRAPLKTIFIDAFPHCQNNFTMRQICGQASAGRAKPAGRNRVLGWRVLKC
jgi:hypothetical protein